MKKLLSPASGEKHFLLGNEAIVRGALEAGVAVAATYPGTPSSEIGDTFKGLMPFTDRLYFEFSANEKVAMEVAVGAAVGGVRSFCFMKHVGLNVAADALMTLAYIGVNGGMVILSADDPGCHSSQNEQDNRYFARFGLLPMLEPSTPQEAKDMVRDGFELSEDLQLPVIVRTTTRVNHMRGIVEFSALPKEVVHKTTFKKEPFRFMCVPGVARTRRPVLLRQIGKAAEKSETSALNSFYGEGKTGVVTSGVSFNYVMDILGEFGLEDVVRVAKLGYTYPLPEVRLTEFMKGLENLLVVEESEPILENELKSLAFTKKLSLEITGLAEGVMPRAGELSPDILRKVIAEWARKEYEPYKPSEPMKLPRRPPNLCAGCPHRSTFYAAKLVTGNKANFNTDIGCYALGLLPPLSMGDILMSMGSSINTGAGFAKATNLPSFAFIGDSTFFHSGMTGLVNAVHNRHDMVLVIMDNRTTAMTGHQPHPGVPMDGMGQQAPPISIEAICRAAGVDFVENVNAFDLKAGIDVFRRAVEHKGFSVVISLGACIFMDRARLAKRPVFQIDEEKCRYCGICADHEGCGETISPEIQTTRAYHRIQALGQNADAAIAPLPPKPIVAPCTIKCPAHICVQSYTTLIAAGRYEEAAAAIRERIPLPRVVGRVCHRPCEEACTRSSYEGSVAINSLKRFAAHYEDIEKVSMELKKRVEDAPHRGKKVGIIGAGPCGLSAAHDLRLRGYDVEIFEASSMAGGMLALGIPEFRLPRDVLAQEIDLLIDLGITLHLDTEVGKDVTFDELGKRGFDAVLTASGAWKEARLGIEGEDALGVYYGLSFLKSTNLGEPKVLGSNVLVLGGGDAAFDAARTARRLSEAEVKILYRRGRDELPASADEVRMAEEEGITVEYLTSPVRVKKGGSERVVSLEMVKNELGEPDKSGRRRPIPIKESEYELPCDSVIVAIGQRPDLSFLDQEISHNERGGVEFDDKTGAVGVDGLFVAGDAATGPKTVIHAIAAGARAAYGIDSYLSGGNWFVPPPRGLELDSEDAEDYRYEPNVVDEIKRVPMREAELQERGLATVEEMAEMAAKVETAETTATAETAEMAESVGRLEVELGYNEEEALAEAERCLVCGSCAKCRICIDTLACPAIFIQEGKIKIDDTLCIGCGVCALLCPNNAIMPREEG